MADELAERWRNLSLTEEETNGIPLEEEVFQLMDDQGDKTIVVKVFTNKPVNVEAMRRTLQTLWRGNFHMKEIRDNLFLFIFNNLFDKRKVLATRPWLFDNHLMLMEEYDGVRQPSEIVLNQSLVWVQVHDLPLNAMTETVGKRVGDWMGKTETVDLDDDVIGWGRLLRIKVTIDVTKPLKKGTMISVPGLNEKKWAYFKYERLPVFCYYCGCLGHSERDCEGWSMARTEGRRQPFQYGPWLRASYTNERRNERGESTGRGERSARGWRNDDDPHANPYSEFPPEKRGRTTWEPEVA